jgi:hypothetical protein
MPANALTASDASFKATIQECSSIPTNHKTGQISLRS